MRTLLYFLLITHFLLFLVLSAIEEIPLSPSKDELVAKKKQRKSNRRNRKARPEKLALQAWAKTLSSKDYELEHWKVASHSSSASDWFHSYAKRISDLFKRNGAKVNFALVGACDGNGDKTIKKLYIPNEHWRGVFVEPMSINVRDLIQYMAEHNIAHRSLVLRGAATMECKEPTIKVERPLYEEKNASIPHWLRRQIGSVLPAHRDHARKEWTIEEVRCLTAQDILREWTVSSTGAMAEVKAQHPLRENTEGRVGAARLRRAHILKIDVEGHDYEVLMSFMRSDTPLTQLPLIIAFEAKSIAKKYPLAKKRMEELGYVVSPFGQDGFAILPAQKVQESIEAEDKERGLWMPGDEEPDV